MIFYRNILTRKEKVSHQKKKSHMERKRVSRKEIVTRGKEKYHGERKCLTAKDKEFVSHRKKNSHNTTIKMLKLIVVNKKICTFLLL